MEDGILLEFYANRETLTWTLITRGNGVVCIRATGKDWMYIITTAGQES